MTDIESKAKLLVNDISSFLLSVSWMYDFCNVRALAEDRHLLAPEAWTNCLARLNSLEDLKRALSRPEEFKDGHLSILSDFAETRNSLANRLYEVIDVESKEEDASLPEAIARGMTAKKQHEVARLGRKIASLCHKLSIQRVVDIGAGVGHLGRCLGSEFGLEVIGAESSSSCCAAATERDSRIKMLNVHIGDDVTANIEALECHLGASPVAVVGLHCCGDLSPNVLKLFHGWKAAKLLCVVSCCYQKMVPASASSASPMSSFVHAHLQRLGTDSHVLSHFSLRLAGQETYAKWAHRTLAQHQRHSRAFGYRAVLEKWAADNGYLIEKKRRRGVRKDSFHSAAEFVGVALDRHTLRNCTAHQSDVGKQLVEMCLDHEPRFAYLGVLTGLQQFLQALLEGFVLLDRLLFLLDNDLPSRIIEVFDPSQSPRSKAILSAKELVL